MTGLMGLQVCFIWIKCGWSWVPTLPRMPKQLWMWGVLHENHCGFPSSGYPSGSHDGTTTDNGYYDSKGNNKVSYYLSQVEEIMNSATSDECEDTNYDDDSVRSSSSSSSSSSGSVSSWRGDETTSLFGDCGW